MMDSAELDGLIATQIEEAGLGRMSNGFFRQAKEAAVVHPDQAVCIAHNWREITKAFMLSTIRGLGVMALHASRESAPSEPLLRTMQTAFAVIGDDLNNNLPVFRQSAPAGVRGIHYLWWEDSVLTPILARCPDGVAATCAVTSPGAAALIAHMDELSQTYLGAAVQLRVVEAIALDIAVAFHRLFGRLEIDGERLFSTSDLTWMEAHIKAEVTHQGQVSDNDFGMARLADTPERQETMLVESRRYVERWSGALRDFERALAPGVESHV